MKTINRISDDKVEIDGVIYFKVNAAVPTEDECDGSGMKPCGNPDCPVGSASGCPECGHDLISKCDGCKNCEKPKPTEVERLTAESIAAGYEVFPIGESHEFEPGYIYEYISTDPRRKDEEWSESGQDSVHESSFLLYRRKKIPFAGYTVPGIYLIDGEEVALTHRFGDSSDLSGPSGITGCNQEITALVKEFTAEELMQVCRGEQ